MTTAPDGNVIPLRPNHRRTDPEPPPGAPTGAPRYLTPEDLAALFQLPSVETVYQWRRKRTGPPGFRVGRHLRYDPEAVRAWVAQQTRTTS